MKRRSFLKGLLAIAALPLVGKAKAEPELKRTLFTDEVIQAQENVSKWRTYQRLPLRTTPLTEGVRPTVYGLEAHQWAINQRNNDLIDACRPYATQRRIR